MRSPSGDVRLSDGRHSDDPGQPLFTQGPRVDRGVAGGSLASASWPTCSRSPVPPPDLRRDRPAPRPGGRRVVPPPGQRRHRLRAPGARAPRGRGPRGRGRRPDRARRLRRLPGASRPRRDPAVLQGLQDRPRDPTPAAPHDAALRPRRRPHRLARDPRLPGRQGGGRARHPDAWRSTRPTSSASPSGTTSRGCRRDGGAHPAHPHPGRPHARPVVGQPAAAGRPRRPRHRLVAAGRRPRAVPPGPARPRPAGPPAGRRPAATGSWWATSAGSPPRRSSSCSPPWPTTPATHWWSSAGDPRSSGCARCCPGRTSSASCTATTSARRTPRSTSSSTPGGTRPTASRPRRPSRPASRWSPRARADRSTWWTTARPGSSTDPATPPTWRRTSTRCTPTPPAAPDGSRRRRGRRRPVVALGQRRPWSATTAR